MVSYKRNRRLVARHYRVCQCWHACYESFHDVSHEQTRQRIAVIGDGSLAFVMANIINYTLPDAELLLSDVIGRSRIILICRSSTLLIAFRGYSFDHGFECCEVVMDVDLLMKTIRVKPQGTILMMRVLVST